MIDQAKNIFIVGIKGVAMANLALILKKLGKQVTGSDIGEEFITDDKLKKYGIAFQTGFNPRKIPNKTDLVIYSSGHQGQNNPQVLQAKKRKIKTITQAEFLSELLKQFKTKIAVCGCHGKTTTTSLLAYALLKLGAKPSYMVGSSSFNGYTGGDYKGKDYFVVEADEYGVNPPYDLTPKFNFLNPDYILCTNIDFDHPDVYQNIEEVKKAFLTFFQTYNQFDATALKLSSSKLFFCADDETLMSVAKKLPRSSYLTYGFSVEADLRIIDDENDKQGSSFALQMQKNRHSGFRLQRLVLHGGQVPRIVVNYDSGVPLRDAAVPRMTTKLFGEKNISNTAGVILTLLRLGFTAKKIKEAIKDFEGAKRRFEQAYVKNDTFLLDDYAHHPSEIKATISAARSRFPKKRIIIIFQPHTYSRTQALLRDFAKSLSLADLSIVLPIFASARENPENYNITSRDIAKFNPKKLTFIETKNNLISYLLSHIKSRDIIFTMGAGDVYKLKDDIIEIIKHKT